MRSLPDRMSAEPDTTLAPPEEPSPPSLLLAIVVEPRLVSVGDTFAVTVTVNNQATSSASDFDAALSFPGAKVSVDAPELSRHDDEWHATRPTLDGGSTAAFTAHVTLEDTPAGGAVLGRVRVLAADGVDIEDVAGALVLDADAGTDAAVIDGASASIRTGDGQVELTFPRNLAVSLIRQVTESQTTLGDWSAPPSVAGCKRGFPTMLITVPGSKDHGDQPFEAPGMLTHRYSCEQLEALGLDEDRLALFRYDAAEHEWARLSTHVDTEARTVTTKITAEGLFQLSEDFTPSEAFIPTLRDWQVALATGTLAHQTAIDVPAGPAGIRPDLALRYSSGATDGRSGRRLKAQSSWVGKGWSLDTGSISMYKTRVFSSELTRFALVTQGVAADLIRAEPLVDLPRPSDPTHWAWRSSNENFVKVRAVGAGDSTSSRGGFRGGAPYPRHLWQVWTKNGMRLEFGEDQWWGWNYCAGDQGHYAYMEAYRWRLSRIVDPHGNAINYVYDRLSTSRPETCFHVRGTVDVDCWPTDITWGGNVNTGESDRYRVEFVSTPRSSDKEFNFAANQYGGINGAPRETRRLVALRIWSMPADAWRLVRQYDFEFADPDHELFSDVRTRRPDGTYGPDRTHHKLTLTGMTRRASDGVTVLPMVRFEYLGGDGGADEYAVGGWQRLSTVDNGQGGVLRLTYENIGSALDRNGLFINHHRLIARATSSGHDGAAFSRTDTWSYSYGTPTYNSLGTALGGGGIAALPNSAELFYNTYWDPSRDNSAWLLHPPLTEFRGHDYVKEIGPDDAQIEHWFHVGALTDDALCPAGYPPDARGAPLTGAAILEHPCFRRLRDRERLKGREYRTDVRTSAGRLLSSVQRRFEVDFLDYTDLPLVGGWRAFVYESELVESAFEGSTTPVTTATRYAYEPAKQGGSQYGNRTRVEQRDHAGIMLRAKDYFYAARDDGTNYLVDRPWQEVVRDGQEGVLALTQFFYDELNTSPGALGARGRRTRVSQYYDVRRQASQQGITLHGIDTTYRYDRYGNVVEKTTFDEPSTRLWSGSALAIGPAGNGQTGATTHTRYDEIFHVYPCETIEPNGLTSTSDYDFHLGTVVSWIDANGNATAAEYDVFGRMAKLIRPGDTSAAPTVQMFYFDAEQPFRYVFAQRERSGQAAVRPVQRLYDGLGREIQVKSESEEGNQNIVVDKQYNGYGEIVAESQPRYVDEFPDAWTPGSSFWRYTNPDDSVVWTTTRYDEAGRPSLVTEADGSSTYHVYEVQQNSAGLRMVVDDAMDANRHRTRHGFDSFGRLVEVSELTGACGVYGGVRYDCASNQAIWATSSVTSYSYDPRDLLTRVTDAAGNNTSMAYDGVGRKTAMVDPDMGSWSYEWDLSGNLVRQTDAMGQVLLLEYDAIDRLTAKLVETWRDDFADGLLTGWTPRGNVVESGGVVTVTGTGTDWTSGLFRQAVATDRGGVTATFKVSDAANGGAVLALHTGTYGQPDYRRWGVAVAGGNLVATVWTGMTEKTTALMPVRPDGVYRVALVADAQQVFRVTLDDRGTPGRRRAFQEAHADWSGRSWGFHAQVRSGTLVLEHYQQVDELSYGYDQGPNGRGQQTSMSSRAETTAWGYDARGRVVEATHLVTALGQPRTFNWSYDSADRVTGVTYPRRADEGRESVSYSYDAAGHPVKLRSKTFDTWYVGSATEGVRYTALGQLQAAPMANGTTQEWSYGAPMQRLSRLAVRDLGGLLLDRSYGYDPSGNVLEIRDHRDPANHQLFAYDHLDRVARWTLGTTTPASYTYDAIGNLLSKAGVAYDYAPRTPWAGGPHAAKTVGGQPYAYDRNGNLLSGGGRQLSWSAENLPIAVTGRDGAVETYGYDAASKRVVKHRAGAATLYVEGLWEETVDAGAKSLYSFHGRVVAVREGASLTSLHHDHVGSVAAATTAGGGVRRRATLQDFDPWGSVRSGGIGATSRNYTGHPLDATGLLYAGARFYDPELARFVSADPVVPVLGGCCCSSGGLESSGRSVPSQGSNRHATPAATPAGERAGTLLQDAVRVVVGGGGAGECGVVKIVATKQGGRALRPLTVTFSETDLVLIANAENAKVQEDGFAFDGDRSGQLRSLASMALCDPQALNRYTYALNNPLGYVDPTGHNACYVAAWTLCSLGSAAATVAVTAACVGGMFFLTPTIAVPCVVALLAVQGGVWACKQALYAACDAPPIPTGSGGGPGGGGNIPGTRGGSGGDCKGCDMQ